MNVVAVRFSNFGLPPFWGASSRFALSALLFVILAFSLRLPFPRGVTFWGACIYGILVFGTFHGLTYYGLVHLGAGPASVLLSLVPLMTLLLAALHRLERFRWRGLAGALLAFSGVGLTYLEQMGLDVPPLAVLALIGATMAFAWASIVAKRLPKAEPLTFNAVGMGAGAIVLYLLSRMAGEGHPLPADPTTWVVFGYLIILGSVLMFFLYLFVLRRWTASATSYQFVLMPVVAIALGAWLADEALSPLFLVSALLVMAGVYVGALWHPRVPAAPVDEVKERPHVHPRR